jgi:predicted ABC-type ATPase
MNTNLSSTDIDQQKSLRLRVFAGPNGSGKSTVIKFVRNYLVDGKPIDFGIYINADDIARQLRENSFSFLDYEITTTNDEFIEIALASGLIGNGFSKSKFLASFSFSGDYLKLTDNDADEVLAQIIADFSRKKLLKEHKKFSFETVFSHPSKLDIMQEAVRNGYKVYLYFVSTKSPEINKFRVLARKAKGGHDKIESRYYRSLELLFDASQIAYQAFYWDNSIDGDEATMFAHFKKNDGKKKWDKINTKNVPDWFRKYYSGKVK